MASLRAGPRFSRRLPLGSIGGISNGRGRRFSITTTAIVLTGAWSKLEMRIRNVLFDRDGLPRGHSVMAAQSRHTWRAARSLRPVPADNSVPVGQIELAGGDR